MPTTPASPATFAEFSEMFPSDDACEAYLVAWRWPSGFVCPGCGSSVATRLRTRALWECRVCGRQTSVTAGTALQHTKVPLRIWVYAIWLVSRRKKGTSALQFQRETGLGSYSTALYLLHKVRGVLAEREESRLSGTVEMDDAILPGKEMKPGKHLGEGGAFIFAGVERKTRHRRDGKAYTASGGARAVVAQHCDSDTAIGFTEANVVEASLVVTDGGAEFAPLVQACVDHDSHDQLGMGAVSDRHLGRVHLFFSNFKTWLRGTFHGVSLRYLSRYLDEYVYRFNRRFQYEGIFGYVARRLVRAAWKPARA